ncbi:hypothetical protein BT96DRAFT_999737 [Gymnopus androsaceus JB14]|uniref:Clr5 domain-containing protein n=1 Tax=Gymnopus androsaceus JB14 TaxID=1447944 RepID=A0A6A4H7F6_9AGAR|nr:hypothetical protein BT96DRAFT_999737 [Gymnopus androsaceus JB14]
MPNQHLPRPPESQIRETLEFFFNMRRTDKEIANLLKDYYDTSQYGCSATTVKRLRKEWNLRGTQQQGHTMESIQEAITEAREIYPFRGANTLRNYIFQQKGMRVPRPLIEKYLRETEPEQVNARKKRRFVRRAFYAAGVNHLWCMDQHDKWGPRFGLWFHNCIDPFTGYNNWMKVWWTNKQPRLVASYFLTAVQALGGLPLLTQSDPGTENYGVANAQTMGRQCLDSSLLGTLQHVFKHRKTNVKSEGNWSVFRRDFVPGYENVFQEGVNLGLLTFRWLAIPWIQAEIDGWANLCNSTAPRRHKYKILLHGPPMLIKMRPQDFNVKDFKVGISPELINELQQEYAPPDHEVFQLTPPIFDDAAQTVYAQMNCPKVNHQSFWVVYRDMLRGLEALATERAYLQHSVDVHAASLEQMNSENNPINSMELLPNQRRRALNDPTVGFHEEQEVKEWEDEEQEESDVACAAFSDDEAEL